MNLPQALVERREEDARQLVVSVSLLRDDEGQLRRMFKKATQRKYVTDAAGAVSQWKSGEEAAHALARPASRCSELT